MSGIYKSAAGERLVRERCLDLLDRWPVANQRLRVPTREGETFVVACGPDDAPPLLLFHGSGANAAMWARDAAAWAAHFRVYAIDMIGEPGLSAPSRPPLTSEAYARWLDDVLAGLGLERASLVGVSLGGWLALDYAIRRPERVERLALLSPAGIGRQRPSFMLKAAFLAPFGRWGRRRALKLALGPAARAAGPHDLALVDFTLLIFTHFRPRLEIPVFDDADLRQVTAPMLVIAGGRDAMLDAHETKRRVEQAAPHATVRFLPEAGHYVPDQTASVIDFLRKPSIAHRDV
jgi:pimeloyl-ACP methyl ester carboxylesterase